MTPLWSANNVQLRSGTARRLRDVHVDVPAGITAVLGYSGAGKTSLLNLLVGFERPTSGSLTSAMPSDDLPVFWVPQNGGLWNHMTAEQHIPPGGARTVIEWLRLLDLESRSQAFPSELSQGERARLSVVRALATQATVLVMDEPLAHVDPGRLIGWFDRIVAEIRGGEDRSLVFATHQPDLVLRFADSVICLDAGTCVFVGSVRDLYEKPGDSRLAALLGLGNWISQDERRVWLDQTDGDDGVIRPESLRVRRVDEQRFRVVRSQPVGGIVETTLRAEPDGPERCFVHHTDRQLSSGDWVRLEVIEEESGRSSE